MRVLCCAIAALACFASASYPQAKKSVLSLSVEGEIENPTPVPKAALAALDADSTSKELLNGCAERAGIARRDIPTTWFTATEVELKRGEHALLVRGDDWCLLGAHITQFWLVSDEGGKWHALFTGRADGVSILSTRTNGYRDVELGFVLEAGRVVQYVTYRYSNGRYKVSGHRNVRSSD